MGATITPRRPTEAELARQVKAFIGDHASRARLAAGANRDQQTVALVESRFPGSTARYGRTALLAAARGKRATGCTWCIAAVLSTAGAERPPDPSSRAVHALLGRPCRGCFRRLREQVWRRELAARRAPLVASGVIWPAGRPPAAATVAAATRPRKVPPPSYYQPYSSAELAARDRRAAEEGRWLQHLRDQA